MAEAGELLNIGDFNNSAHYDHNCHDHYHLMCEDCKRIFDVEGDYSGILSESVKSDEFDITSYHLTFSGLCRECKKRRNK